MASTAVPLVGWVIAVTVSGSLSGSLSLVRTGTTVAGLACAMVIVSLTATGALFTGGAVAVTVIAFTARA